MTTLRLYRQDEVSRRYPASTWVLEVERARGSGSLLEPDWPGRSWRVELKNPADPSWWTTWVFNPQFTGMRWRGIKEGLRFVRVEGAGR